MLWFGGPIDDHSNSSGNGVAAGYAVFGHAGLFPGSDAFARRDTFGGHIP